jgi:hypothetical protein
VDLSVWRRASQLATDLDAVPAFVAGIKLAPGGERLVEELGIEAQPTLDVAVRAEGDVPVLRGLMRLGETRGIAAKLRLLARELFPTPTFMRLSSPLARRGPLGLTAAYAVRPLWILWRLPAAFRAYRRARRAAQ